MAVTCRLFRSVASYINKPEEIISSLNDSLADGNDSNMFCTAFIGILCLKTGELKYCNAGHNAPLIMDPEGKISMLDVKPNLPLGLFDGFPYEGQETTINRNTMLYLFTDGVTEAENDKKELLGDDKLVAFLKMNASEDPGVLIDLTFEEIKTHANGAEQSDDITVMCIKYC